MKSPSIMIGYGLGALMAIAGLLILFGLLVPRRPETATISTIFGVIILLFGLYRMAVTDTKRRIEARREREAARGD